MIVKSQQNIIELVTRPGWYQGKFQDCMRIVQKFGRPHLFLTFTANGQWEDTKASLFEGQDPLRRPDMVVRLFHAKLEEFKNDILKKQKMGRVKAYSYVIEFQKRGLPHVHMVVWLDERDAPKTPEDIDRFLTAEIPDPKTSPRLYELVKKTMIHGPCKGVLTDPHKGPPCWKNQDCEKQFPKDHRKHTVFGDRAAAEYRRRGPEDGGHTFPAFTSRYVEHPVELTNKWIVPYNRFLLAKYKAHINVEVIASVSAIKYLFKYITKGQVCLFQFLSFW